MQQPNDQVRQPLSAVTATFNVATCRYELGAQGPKGASLLVETIKVLNERVDYNGQIASVDYKSGGYVAKAVNEAAAVLGLTDWRTRFF